MKTIPTGASVVVMIGPSGAGKSTFIEKHFAAREVVSSDGIRLEMVGDIRRQDKNDQVFEELSRRVVAKVGVGQRVVIDATHLRDKDRKKSAELGFMMDVPVTYVVVNRSVVAKLQTGGWRLDVTMKDGLGLIEQHEQTFVANEKKILAGDRQKGVMVVDTRVDTFEVAQELPRDNPEFRLASRGFNRVRVVADIHGNLDGFEKAIDVPDSTFLLFLGDLLDYDPRGIEVVERVNKMVQEGRAISLRGNHEKKIANWVVKERGTGFTGNVSHGNDATVNIVKAMSAGKRAKWEATFLGLVEMSPDWIQLGRFMFAHAAVHHSMWGDTIARAHKNSKQESFAMYGETSGKFVDGYPERLYNWVETIPARHVAVVGHAVLSTDEPVTKQGKGGKAVFLDTGSSKEVDGVQGHLSWMELTIDASGRVEFDSFGRE